MVAFSPQRKKEFRFIRSSTQHAYMHTKFWLSYNENWHLSLLVILILEHPRQIQVLYIKIHFFFYFLILKLPGCSVHYSSVYIGIFLYMYTLFHTCMLRICYVQFVSNFGIFWKKNLLKEKCWSRRNMCLSRDTCMDSCCALIHGTEMTRYKMILSARIHARKFCWILEKYIN